MPDRPVRPRPRPHPGPPVLPYLAMWASCLLVTGCIDQPLPSPTPPDNTPPHLVAGPYADGGGPYGRDRVTLRFLTNRPAVPGVSRRDASVRVVERAGVGDRDQRITVAFLAPDAADPVRMMFDDRPGPELALRGVADRGQPSRLLFVDRPADWAAFGWRAVEELPDGLVVLGPPLPPRPEGAPAPDPADVQRDFLAPLGAVAWTVPLHFAPGATRGLPRHLFPPARDEAAAGVWARDVGAIRLVAFDARRLLDPAAREATLRGVRRAGENLPPGVRWRVGVCTLPPMDRDGVNPELAHAVGDRLERAGLDWVVSGGGRGGYARTAAFAGAAGGMTRYAVLSPADAAGAGPDADYVAAAGPAVGAVLDGDARSLRWRAFDAAGATVDEHVLHAGLAVAERVVARAEVDAGAAALVEQGRELGRIVRQLARRVPDPRAPGELALRAENASDLPMTLEFAWDDDNGAGEYAITPARTTLVLPSWRGGHVRFTISPGSNGAAGTLMPRAEAWLAAPFSPTPATVNGRLDEEAWVAFRDRPPVTDFVRLGDGAAPARATKAAVVADPRGLLVGFRVAANTPMDMPGRTENANPDAIHDHPDVARDESVEVWIDAARDGRDWKRFVVNAFRASLEADSREGADWSPTWEYNARVAERNTAIDYEIRIPWSVFGLDGPPEAGTEWAINLVRNDIEPVRDALARREPDANPDVYTASRVEGDLTRSGLYTFVRFTGRAP